MKRASFNRKPITRIGSSFQEREKEVQVDEYLDDIKKQLQFVEF